MQGSPPGDNTSIALHRRKGPGRGIETDDLAQLIADAGLVAARHGLAGKRERERERERERVVVKLRGAARVGELQDTCRSRIKK